MRGRNLQRVAIVAYSAACLLPERMKECGIIILAPVALIFENRVYRDGIDTSPADFYEMLRQAEELPTSSGSSPASYLEAYEKPSRKPRVLSVSLSHSGSAPCLTRQD